MTTGDLNHDSEEPMDTVEKQQPQRLSDSKPDMNGVSDGILEDMDDDDDYKSEATFRFEVKNFSKLKETQLSSPCVVRGLPWKVMVMPRDHMRSRALGFFVQCNADSDIPNWSCSAHAILRLISQKEGIPHHERKIQHVFFPKENDWGYSCFMSWDQVCDSDRGYIKDDTVIFEVYVNADAPHGVQWDSKKHTGYVGLKNQGATCYMNSLLQTLFFTNKLRKAVYQMPTAGDDPAKSVPLAMQRVFYELQFSDKPVGTKKLTKSFGWDTFDSFLQHDVQELCRVLLDNLESKMKGTPLERTIPNLFEGKMRSYIKCKNVPFESNRDEPFYDVQLNVKGKKNVYESFDDYVAVESLEGDNKYDAGDYGMQDAEKGIRFLSFPPVLHLQLMRFQYDPMTDQNVKVNDRFEFPEKLDLDKFLLKNESTPAKYTLHAVLVHSGDFHGGHYVVFINPKGTGKWCKFDDDVVSRCSKQEAIEANYGGDDDLPARHCTNAYMLVYIRDSAIAEVLQAATDKDISLQLRERLEEERQQDALRKKEKSEAHLYLTVMIILDDCFSGHQTFELFDADMVEKLARKFKVKKSTPLSEFYAMLASHFKLKDNQFRLWPFVNRKNGTHRPSPIKDRHPDRTVEDCAEHSNPWQVYMELYDFSMQKELPSIDSENEVLIFLKYFDSRHQLVSSCGSMIVNQKSTLRDIMPEMCRRAHLPRNEELKVFEEVKYGVVEQLMGFELPLQEQIDEISDGDILIFQEKDDQFPDAKEYFTELYNRIEVEFIDRTDENIRHQITCSMRNTYYEVAKALAERIEYDPFKIQFYKSNPYRDIVGPAVRYIADLQLKDIFEIRQKQSRVGIFKLFYQKVPFRLDEMETKRMMKIVWMDSKMKTEEILVYPDKNGTVKTVFDEIRKSAELAANGSNKLRMLEISSHKISRICDPDQKIDELMLTSRQYRVEEIPMDQLQIDPKTEYLLPVAHFHKEPLNTFGDPFYLKVKAGDIFIAVKNRIQKLLEIPDKEYEKFKFALVHLNKPQYIEMAQMQSFSINLNDLNVTTSYQKPWLGLDHLNKQSRRTSGHPLEKAIVIHN